VSLIFRAGVAFHNAFRSEGARLFGWRFGFDYLRIAAHVARRWGATDSGECRLLGYRISYPNQSHAFALLHEVFVHAPYAPGELPPRPRIIDCGANIGCSLIFFKACAPNASILAIEAAPDSFAYLERVVTLNALEDVTLVQAAVTGHDGTVTLHSAPGDPGSITASVSAGWGGPFEQTVPARRLSSFIDGPVDFIKLDVEGAEYEVIDDLVATGRLALVHAMAIECHEVGRSDDAPASLVAQLEQSGMRVTMVRNPPARTALVRAERA